MAETLIKTTAPHPFQFGTKAQTLERLKPLVETARVSQLFYFSLANWFQAPQGILEQIQAQFQDKQLIIRSSAFGEDSAESSMAGAFTSCLNVDGSQSAELAQAIEVVLNSYGSEPEPCHHILVQPMLTNILVSGVMTTFALSDGGPYYVLNYDDESGKTDTVTGGTGVNKTVYIHRNTADSLIESSRVKTWLNLAKELEGLCQNPALDIEFAQVEEEGKEVLYLLQVRPITVDKNWNPRVREQISASQSFIENYIQEISSPRPHVAGERTILGEMPDWNPAEIIGTSPRPLTVSLYRYLVTDHIWRDARGLMGYYNPPHERLMSLIGGRPYIDVRNSFNSLLPASLPDELSNKLVNAWLSRLDCYPEFHDKVEFDVATTALDFNFQHQIHSRYGDCLSNEEVATFRGALQKLTCRCLDLSESGTLKKALQEIETLTSLQKPYDPIQFQNISETELLVYTRRILDQCRDLGTLPFSVIARHAFIAEALLRSAVVRGALSDERLLAFKRTIHTVTTDMSGAFKAVLNGELSKTDFFKRFGHLRPGTYDILSLRYDQRDDLFTHCVSQPANEMTSAGHDDSATGTFQLTEAEFQSIEALLKEAQFQNFTPDDVLTYGRLSIAGREYAKFVFTRSLSEALEVLSLWGERVGLTREELTYIPIQQLLDILNVPILENKESYFSQMVHLGQQSIEMAQSLRLGYLIRDIRDIYVIPLHRSAPNFVTNQNIQGLPIHLNNRSSGDIELQGKIVCIENADPGFDWIFTRGIAGLITKFGGANSHMAIRCAEFNLPAAIGCGEQTFDRIVQSNQVELRCGDKLVRPVYES